MRIISGKFGGRNIVTPTKGVPNGFRPTTDRVKEAIFSSLGSLIEIDSALVLDLYAGSGSIGMECLSRGANFCVFVERDKKLVNFLEKTLVDFAVTDNSIVIDKNVFPALKDLAESQRKFDVVFADPPYENHPGGDLVDKILGSEIVSEGSLIVVEAGSKTELKDRYESGNLIAECIKDKKYGDTRVCFYSCKFVSR